MIQWPQSTPISVSKGRMRNVCSIVGDLAGARMLLSYSQEEQFSNYCFTIYTTRKEIHANIDGLEKFISDAPISRQCLVDCEELWISTSVPTGKELEIAEYAKELGIPIHAFVEHYINMEERFRTSQEKIIRPDHLFVTSVASCNAALGVLGVMREQITIIENPYYKWLSKQEPRLLGSNIQELLDSEGDGYALYLIEPISTFDLEGQYGCNELTLIEDLWKIWTDMDIRGKIVIKPHPNQDRSMFEEFCASVRTSKIVMVDDVDVKDLMHNSRCVVGLHSTAMLEAKAMGCDVIRGTYLTKETCGDVLEALDNACGVRCMDKALFVEAISSRMRK